MGESTINAKKHLPELVIGLLLVILAGVGGYIFAKDRTDTAQTIALKNLEANVALLYQETVKLTGEVTALKIIQEKLLLLREGD